MTTVLLVRHGLTRMTGPVLAGWTPELHLDERGQKQADSVAARLAELPLTAVVSSPLERCVDTATAILTGRDITLQV
ncbi:MAG TPA: histidine phosphatase family protein, partial [Mycobacteriales bacterium]|nr:histidine phosphatase family protein [Mycobacteriales bacterium]